MSNDWIARDVLMSFEEFASEVPSDKLPAYNKPLCLADFIQAWLEDGRGVIACAGDYQTFVRGFVIITEAWLKEPHMLDYVHDYVPGENEAVVEERRVTTIFGDVGYVHRALDPHYFARCTFRHWAHCISQPPTQ